VTIGMALIANWHC